MMPEGCGGVGAAADTGKEKKSVMVEGREPKGEWEWEGMKRLNADDDGVEDGAMQKRNQTVSVKKWFPSLEFR